jgi:hypothetical protein
LPVGANLAFALTWLLADTTRFLFPGEFLHFFLAVRQFLDLFRVQAEQHGLE